MQDTELKLATKLEDTICCIANKIMNTPYNWSLVLMTIILWVFGGAIFPYSANSNFDMAIAINEYAKLMGLAAIVLGVLKQSSQRIIGLGVCCYLLSLASVLMSKTLFASGLVGELALKPLAIFCFLLLLKNILLIANEATKTQER
ncbi:MAG: hypothetical protein K2P31_01610 [Rickettsiaceae bacterium]|nr:hypothetical protein [Rickettsiaceae bacterium]